ncbi:O-sialoglycoprotein endopeptidase [Eubacteriales bacterium OttesenSCG-928-N13]|nr:O-sialoglycoprotein endopeptidase [Eubacteriales bacterium OttesenSCG-928-N13]
MSSLGIDTSCYRTSVAYADDAGFAQRRQLLTVPQGKRGLQQSELVFQHVQNLPTLVEQLMDEASSAIDCVCVSTRPRPVDGSYMPVFTVGAGLGRSIAAMLRVPFYETTHQQCHLRAALVGSRMERGGFLALHLSGGTSELLLSDESLSVQRIGGTNDLNAGQLVDRVGVALGAEFPAGPSLERMAQGFAPKAIIPTSIRELACSFSGAEAQAMRMIESGNYAPGEVAVEVYSLIARTLAKLLSRASDEQGISQALLFGGVASSALLRQMLADRMKKLRNDLIIHWADPALSGDNAVGAALIGHEMHASIKANNIRGNNT